MIPHSPLIDLSTVANAMLDDNHTDYDSFASTGEGITNQLQQSNYQVTQPNYLNQGENNNDNLNYDELLSITDELLTNTITPLQSSNSSNINTQSLDNVEEFSLSTIENFQLSLLSPPQPSRQFDATANTFENCAVSSTSLLDSNFPNTLDNVPCVPITQAELYHQYNQPNLQQVHTTVANSHNSLSQSIYSPIPSQFHETQSSTQDLVPVTATPNVYLFEHNAVLTTSAGVIAESTIDSLTFVPLPVEQNLLPPSGSIYSSQNSRNDFTFVPSPVEQNILSLSGSIYSSQNSQSDFFTFGTGVSQNQQDLESQALNCDVEANNKTKSPHVKLQHVCPISDCKKAFVHAPSLIRHMNWHKGKENFVCQHCDKKFTRKDNFTKHEVLCKNSQELTRCQCPNCSADGGNNIRDSKGKLLHNCHHPGCKKAFNRIVLLDEHLRSHNGEKPYVCNWGSCRKSFVRKSSLVAHVKLHKSSKSTEGSVMLHKKSKSTISNADSDKKNSKSKYICHKPDCAKVFSHYANLHRHLKSHSGTKKFICAHCGKRLTRKNHLEKHIQKHTVDEQNKFYVEPQFICHIAECGKIYDLRKELNAHLKSQHGILYPYVCTTCDKKFERKNDCEQHMETHSAEKKFVCPRCGKRFRRSQHLNTHIFRMHTA